MIAPALQRISLVFFFVAFAAASAAELQTGEVARLRFQDVDGNEHFTAKGNVTIVTVVTRQNEAKAQAVADRVPDRCVGNPKYRYLTVVNFQRKIFGPFQGLTKTIIRARLTSEANKLRPEYAAKHIARDPRQDILVVADFDGGAVSQLGIPVDSNKFGVFVFNGHGKLVARWDDVPSEEAMTRAISAAE